ncbi:CHAT domain-containing protein [Streptosporangium sp. LJ11]|uniref:CHAT domain-containing protein n=1 Tax=Streptosporangium sp. LJ11 TaxID=3436927 RepID=UPI003F7A834A
MDVRGWTRASRIAWRLIRGPVPSWPEVGRLLADEPADVLERLERLLLVALRQTRAQPGQDPRAVTWMTDLSWVVQTLRLRGSRETPRLPIDGLPLGVPTTVSHLYGPLEELLNASDADRAAAILAAHPEILGPEVDAALTEFASALEVYRRFGEAHRVRRYLAGLRAGGVFHPDEFIPPEAALRRVRELSERFGRLCRTAHEPAVADAAIDDGERLLLHPQWPGLHDEVRILHLHELANAYTDRFERTGRTSDAERGVTLNRTLGDHTPLDHPERPGYLANLGKSLHVLGRIEEAVPILRTAVKTAGPRSPHRFLFLNSLGNALRDLSELRDDDVTLDWAIAACRLAASEEARPDALYPTYVANLSLTLLARYRRRRDPADLTAAIGTGREAVRLDPEGHYVRGRLAEMLIDTGQYGAARVMIEEALARVPSGAAIREHYRAVRRTLREVRDPGVRPDDPMAEAQRVVAVALAEDSSAADRRAALDRIVDALLVAVSSANSHQERIELLDRLASAFHTRYLEFDRLEDLDQVIDINAALVRDEATSERLIRWAARLCDRYREVPDVETLREAVDVYRQALTASPPDEPDRWEYAQELGDALSMLYRATDDVTLLREAAHLRTEALGQLTVDHPERPSVLLKLAVDRYELAAHDPATTDADLRGLVAEVGPDPAALAGFGDRLVDRYLRYGLPADLDNAIVLLRGALAGTGDDIEAVYRTARLGGALRLRATGSTRLKDLHEAESLLRNRLATTTIPGPAARLGFELAGVLHEVYTATGDAAALDECVRFDEDAIRSSGRADSQYIGGLCTALITRYELLGRRVDLDRAAALLREATARELPRTPKAVMLNALGSALRLQAETEERPELLAAAITAIRQAVDLLPATAPYRAQYLANLAGLLAAQDRDAGVLDAAVTSARASLSVAPSDEVRARLRLALADLLSARGDDEEAGAELAAAALFADPAVRARANRKRGDLLSARESWRPAAEAYAACVAGFNDVFAIQHTRHHQEAWLRELSGVPGAAASAFVKAGDLDAAIDVLETGRTRLLAQALAGSPRNGEPRLPLVHLIPSGEECLAVITPPEGERCALHLPWGGSALLDRALEYTTALVSEDDDRWARVLDDTTGWLGETIMGPVLDTVGTPAALTLVPTGGLTLLPLHAAWTADPDAPGVRRYALDTTTIRYAPNAALRPATSRPPSSALSVADPQPVTADRLPYSELEGRGLAALLPHTVTLHGPAAGKDAVRAHLPSARLVLFSCHATTDVRTVADNGFLLAHDEVLSLRDLLALPLTADLVIASGCQTAFPDVSALDEVISLSTGLLQAGAGSVLATAWKISDGPSMIVVLATLRRWLTDGLPPAEALRAAQSWLRAATTTDILTRFTDWYPAEVPSLRRLLAFEDPDAIPFAHPVHWAAFAFHGG